MHAVCAIGMLLMIRIGPHASYLTDVLPAVVVFGFGLCLTVAPLTATVLASADVRHAGVASGVNNAVARAAGLVAVAALPAIVGLTAASYHEPASFNHGFDLATAISAAILLVAAALAAVLINNNVLRPAPAAAGARSQDQLHGRGTAAAAGAAPVATPLRCPSRASRPGRRPAPAAPGPPVPVAAGRSRRTPGRPACRPR